MNGYPPPTIQEVPTYYLIMRTPSPQKVSWWIFNLRDIQDLPTAVDCPPEER